MVLAGDDARLTGFDEFLEAAAGRKAFPLDHSLFGIEVAEGERPECPSPARAEGPDPLTCRPAPRRTSR